MKKIWKIVALALVAVMTFGAAGAVFAQTQTTPTPPYPGYGPGMMGGRGGMMRGDRAGEGPLHDVMVAAFAEVLGLEPADLEARLENGERMWEIAESLGFTPEEFGDLWLEARAAALEQAVAEGLISQEMADWMTERMQQRQAAGYGPGSGMCGGGSRFGGRQAGPGWRWNTP